jgi:hypothetical protein
MRSESALNKTSSTIDGPRFYDHFKTQELQLPESEREVWGCAVCDSWKDPFHKMQSCQVSFPFFIHMCALSIIRTLERCFSRLVRVNLSFSHTNTLGLAHMFTIKSGVLVVFRPDGWMAAGAGDTFF